MLLRHYLAADHVKRRRKSPYAMLLGFAPIVAFTMLTNLSQDLALWASFAAAFAVGIRDFAQERVVRLLDIGSTVIFGLLALYAGFVQPGLSIQMTRLVVDLGFFALALLSMLILSPLTLQYAREQVPREISSRTRFVLTNYGLTALWMLAFAVMAAADALSNIDKRLPLSLDAAVGLVVLVAALIVTARYLVRLHSHDHEERQSLITGAAHAAPGTMRP
ncbi:MAG TPA: hypothetical protein VNX86_01895 [Rhizomicrobium sp.]|nr:hypothetical protein [Rhizomicrobium sp.]